MVDDIRLLVFRLEAWTICFELEHCDFLIISVGAKAHLMNWLGKPDASLLRYAGKRSVGIIAPCGKCLCRQLEDVRAGNKWLTYFRFRMRLWNSRD